MDINLVHPELRKATASFPKLPVGSNFGRKLTRLLLPLLLPKTKLPQGTTIEWVKAASGQKLRVYTPAGTKTRAAMLYIHGGGMMIGAPQMDDGLLSNLAAELDILIVSPEYRLAPEHPYPAPVDDCHEAWQWMLSNSSQRGIDTKRIAIGGESAGMCRYVQVCAGRCRSVPVCVGLFPTKPVVAGLLWSEPVGAGRS